MDPFSGGVGLEEVSVDETTTAQSSAYKSWLERLKRYFTPAAQVQSDSDDEFFEPDPRLAPW